MSGPLIAQPFGPLDALYAAIRRGLPQVLVSHVQGEGGCIRVTYRSRGPADLAWDADAAEYRWVAGADPTSYIGGPELEEVVKSIAEYLGAAIPPAAP